MTSQKQSVQQHPIQQLRLEEAQQKRQYQDQHVADHRENEALHLADHEDCDGGADEEAGEAFQADPCDVLPDGKVRGDGCEIPHTVRCLADPDGAAALRDLVEVAAVDQREDHEDRRGEEKDFPQVDAVLAGVRDPDHLIHAGPVLDIVQ